MKKGKLVHEKPTVWIGKKGLGQEVLSEIRRQLEGRGYVKIKVQKSALAGRSVKEVARDVAEGLGAKVIDVRGRTFIIAKKRKIRSGAT